MTKFPSAAMAAFTAAIIVLPSAACAVPLFERLLSSVGSANSRSPGVSLADVAKEVAPQTFQIDPRAVQGRRLILDGSDAGKRICIGAWRNTECFGIYIEPPQGVAVPPAPPAPR